MKNDGWRVYDLGNIDPTDQKGAHMRIAVKGRNTRVTQGLRDHIGRRFHTIDRQVSDLAELEIELIEERNPAIADSQIAEATLHVKGATLRAQGASPDMMHSVNLCAEQLARQVKRHRDKRRKRRETRAAQAAVSDVASAP